MQSGSGRETGFGSVLDEAEGVLARLAARETALAELESIVEKQQDLIERYDAVLRDMAPGRRRPPRDDAPLAAALERTLALLDHAISAAEGRSRQVAELEGQLDRTLELLERSLRNQEAAAARGPRPEVPPGAGAPVAAVPPELEQTLAKYDRMLERSLAALETAYRSGQTTRKELDERDRLLNRTLDLLQSTVEAEGSPRRGGLFGRLLG